ncbi:unnamed protein product, partial [Arabidopsis halleri]
MKIDPRCQTCGFEGESIEHVLFSCPLSRQIWALSDYPAPENGMSSGSVFSIIQHFLINRDNLRWPAALRKSFPWIIWRIWKNRNLLFFEGKIFSALESVEKIKNDVEEWSLAQEVDIERDTVMTSADVGRPNAQIMAVPRWTPP